MDNTNTNHGDTQVGAALDKEHLRKLRALHAEEKLDASLYIDVDEEQLGSFSCIQLQNIDVDINHGSRASAATFFQPSEPISDELKQALSQTWSEAGSGQALWVYPRHKAAWFTGPWLEIDGLGGTAWHMIEDRWCVREATDLILPRGCIRILPNSFEYVHEYFSDFAFFPKDEKKPHLASIICDTWVSPDMILRSEVHGAIALVKYQLALNLFHGHRIKPIMLYTFQSDQYARITQVYYDPDMGKIVLRQSRQLDLRGPKPTEDAWLLLRWMLNTPDGDTVIKSEDGGLPVRAKEPSASPLMPTTDAIA